MKNHRNSTKQLTNAIDCFASFSHLLAKCVYRVRQWFDGHDHSELTMGSAEPSHVMNIFSIASCSPPPASRISCRYALGNAHPHAQPPPFPLPSRERSTNDRNHRLQRLEEFEHHMVDIHGQIAQHEALEAKLTEQKSKFEQLTMTQEAECAAFRHCYFFLFFFVCVCVCVSVCVCVCVFVSFESVYLVMRLVYCLNEKQWFGSPPVPRPEYLSPSPSCPTHSG
jgi:hypothetical protein